MRNLFFGLMLGLAAMAPPVRASDLPSWLAGGWQQQRGENCVEEYWTPPRGGVMIGTGRTGKGDALKSWELMRIVRGADGTLTFHGAPQGGTAVAFALVTQTPDALVFANPAHDYPQRIRYWRDGADLHAEISLMDGSQAMQWTYSPITQ